MRINPLLILLATVALLAGLGTGAAIVAKTRKSGPRWTGLTPAARAKVNELEQAAKARGLNVMFWDGWRSPASSAANIAAGTSKLKDPLNSTHVWGVGFDVVFRNAAGLPFWPPDNDPRWRQLAEVGRSIGLFSGGLAWGWDWPHFQLPGVNLVDIRHRWGANYAGFLASQGATLIA